jgi:hypothetical protein
VSRTGEPTLIMKTHDLILGSSHRRGADDLFRTDGPPKIARILVLSAEPELQVTREISVPVFSSRKSNSRKLVGTEVFGFAFGHSVLVSQ